VTGDRQTKGDTGYKSAELTNPSTWWRNATSQYTEGDELFKPEKALS
jgi:hypothetical protein